MKHIIDRHERVVLFFSGGKDSLTCLLLLRPYWDRLTVCWINTGAANWGAAGVQNRASSSLSEGVPRKKT